MAAHAGRLKTIIVRSGNAELGRWWQERVNVYQDYKERFGRELSRGLGIGLLSSAEVAQSVAITDYDDFVLIPAQSKTAEQMPLIRPGSDICLYRTAGGRRQRWR